MKTVDAKDMTTDDLAIALMKRLCHSDPLPITELTRSLGIQRSQLERLLALMGHSDALGGLDYVQEIHDGHRALVSLTDKGRALCADNRATRE